ncbi:uncharacterized protein LOC105253992 [Camponotus floridanus]|uniref:uncharacterized protein LOC105253992 n=1 Tax=Camponotus floridanus TaxID=104421 RepID=UPI000DC6C8E3|nr:uncharacterized protein LOC105253992 [Camponotus floridanus]
MMKGIIIVQINLNHCWGAHNILQQFMKEREIEIAFISEPIYIPAKNWVSSMNKNAAICWSPNSNTRIIESIKEEEFVALEIEDIIMISCYISPKYSLKEFSAVLNRIENRIKNLDKGRQIILGGDFNAHSLAWGSRYTSSKGKKLLNLMEELNLLLVNSGNSPTCTRQQGNSIIDLTWATPKTLGRIGKWTVEDTVLSLSDHNYITYSINMKKLAHIPVAPTSTPRRWRTDNIDEELFEEAIEWSCHSCSFQGTPIARDVEWIDKTISQAADLSMKRAKKPGKRKQAYWWNNNIAELRLKCNYHRRKWTRAKSSCKKDKTKAHTNKYNQEELSELANLYKVAKKDLSQAVYQAKENSWKELIREIDKDPWGIPYKLVMNKLKLSGLSIREILDEHTLKEVIHKLFPRDKNRNYNLKCRRNEWKEEWDL